jgi:16S rRNA (adenine1518-N6/adenine1519-N6)-dimethyltransferase
VTENQSVNDGNTGDGDRRAGADRFGLLGATDIRQLAERMGLRPTKSRGQNFVHDANTVRRIARISTVTEDDQVLEVGSGLGSLTLALLETGASVTAVEVEPALARALPDIVAERAPAAASRLRVITADALTLRAVPGPEPTAIVANLPYNVAVPVLLTALERFPGLRSGLVMVQAEVAERLAAAPGGSAYGVPTVKVAWYATARLAGAVPRGVFWPVPNVDSQLVALTRRSAPRTAVSREEVFSCVDAAFAQRRKTLRAALATWAGSARAAEEILRTVGIDPGIRGEQLTVAQFADIAEARSRETTRRIPRS